MHAPGVGAVWDSGCSLLRTEDAALLPTKTSLVNGQGLGSLPIADNTGFQVAFTRFIKVLVRLFWSPLSCLGETFFESLATNASGVGGCWWWGLESVLGGVRQCSAESGGRNNGRGRVVLSDQYSINLWWWLVGTFWAVALWWHRGNTFHGLGLGKRK